jgi:trans-aconitate methyltransferase
MSESSKDFFRQEYLNQSDLMETGFGGTEAEWRHCRELILEAVDHDGKLLDLGCANGRLVHDLQVWAKDKNIKLDVYGIDFVPELIEKAKSRMPDIADHFSVVDINEYTPDQNFDYIRTELIHFQTEKLKENLERYLSKVNAGGSLITTFYDDDVGDNFKGLIEYMDKLGLGEFGVIKNDATCLVVYKK